MMTQLVIMGGSIFATCLSGDASTEVDRKTRSVFGYRICVQFSRRTWEWTYRATTVQFLRNHSEVILKRDHTWQSPPTAEILTLPTLELDWIEGRSQD